MSRVFFNPPLRLQRQAWVLSQLREHHAETVFEVGCNDAPLMQAVLPAPLYVTPDESWRKSGIRATGVAKHTIFKAGPVSPKKVVILDLDATALKEPIKILEQEKAKASQRWRDMHIKVICGSLDEDYTEMSGPVDVIVATEIIEHLPDSVLCNFAACMLAGYRPKVLLITTPNYSFNKRFGKGLLDPTGRTDRLFRHSDHKFEWTRGEFEEWCQGAAKFHHYHLITSGVGEAVSPTDEPSEEDRYASHTAIFTRMDDIETSSSASLPLCFTRSIPTFELDYLLEADLPDTDPSIDGDQVRQLTCDLILSIGEEIGIDSRCKADLWSVWMDAQLRWLLGGRLDLWFEMIGIRFEGEIFSCKHDITLIAESTDLYLTCPLQIETATEGSNDPHEQS